MPFSVFPLAPARRLTAAFPLILAVVLAGCLPSSCRRTESRALLPADSLSRQAAEAVPVDSLRLVHRTAASEAVPLEYPRTVAYGPSGRLYAADTERHSVFVFDADGRFLREVADEAFEYPYLAGTMDSTVAVFSAGGRRIDFVADGAVRPGFALPEATRDRSLLVYAAALDSALYVKVVGEDAGGYIARVTPEGGFEDRVALPGPTWRHAGLLRTWGDTLLSLSGFRPVVDVLPPGGGRDTLALVGFDSPMLARSRSYLLGEVDQPPLLAPAAAAAGDLLFVLNLRPGWLRVDAFGRDGRLRHRLEAGPAAYNQAFYPQDLAARRLADGTYELAVVFTAPQPRLDVYRWRPGGRVNGE